MLREGEKPHAPQTNTDLETQYVYQPRKEVNLIPSPFGEGSTDMPIDHHPQGEVPRQTPLPSPLKGRS